MASSSPARAAARNTTRRPRAGRGWRGSHAEIHAVSADLPRLAFDYRPRVFRAAQIRDADDAKLGEGERLADGLVVAMKRGNAREAKGPCRRRSFRGAETGPPSSRARHQKAQSGVVLGQYLPEERGARSVLLPVP